MKKKREAIILSFLLLLLLIFAFFPRKVEHGVFISTNLEKSTFYVNGKEKSFSTKYIFNESNTVWNFYYNLFGAFDFKQQMPLAERIMVKKDDSYDLEISGFISLNKKANYYNLDKDNTLSPTTSRKLVVGKTNVKAFKDSKGNLKTFILAPMNYSQMRVAISTTNFTSIYHEKIQIKTSAPVKIYSLREDFNLAMVGNYNITLENKEGTIYISTMDSLNNIVSKDVKERLYIKGDSMIVSSLLRGAPTFSPAYNGIIEIAPSSKGLIMINEVNLEDYLKKVVPSEMPASSALESLKCQAIAARTYATSDMLLNRFSNLGFYVDDSTQSQVYNNVEPQDRTTEAINSTRGIIMTFKGEPIDAKYYSTSAGTGVNYEDIWFDSDRHSEDRPYLSTKNYISSNQSLPTNEDSWLNFYKDKTLSAVDSSSPYFRWQIEFPKEALTRSLNKSIKSIYENRKEFLTIKQGKKVIKELPELKNILNISVLERSEGGNVIKIAFYFENATVEVLGDYNIRGAIRCSSDFAGTQIPVVRYKSSPLTNVNYLPSSFFSVENFEDKFTIYGGGYGHGVGMSQYGAMELGKQGMAYKNILNTFYNDISLEHLY